MLSACGFTHGVASSQGDGRGPGSDVGPGSDGGDGGTPCFGSGLATVCAQLPVPAKWTVSSPTNFDTSTDCDFQVAGLCVKQAVDVDISDTLGVVGPLPLVVLATHDLDVSGTIDGSSIVGFTGPGANAAECVAGSPGANDGGNSANAGGGGGAGGSFGGGGGPGSPGGKPGGTPGPTITATSVHGGCPGTGGGNHKGTQGANPGDGGGAVYLIAGDMISIEGAINASGSGGRGGAAQAGGGGGGSGGLVGLDAPKVKVTGKVFANGGGGGEGGDTSNSGADGGSSVDAAAAPGGSGGSIGGDGGDGAAGTTLAGGAGLPRQNNAGGGGGGGAGVVKVFASAPQLSGTISPPAS
jgi:hypothetical protein